MKPQTTEEKEKHLKPGKWYGIVALLCGLFPFLYIMGFLVFGHRLDPLQSPWHGIVWSLRVIALLSVPAAFVFGIMGLQTKGRHHARIGLSLAKLFVLIIRMTIWLVLVVLVFGLAFLFLFLNALWGYSY